MRFPVAFAPTASSLRCASVKRALAARACTCRPAFSLKRPCPPCGLRAERCRGGAGRRGCGPLDGAPFHCGISPGPGASSAEGRASGSDLWQVCAAASFHEAVHGLACWAGLFSPYTAQCLTGRPPPLPTPVPLPQGRHALRVARHERRPGGGIAHGALPGAHAVSGSHVDAPRFLFRHRKGCSLHALAHAPFPPSQGRLLMRLFDLGTGRCLRASWCPLPEPDPEAGVSLPSNPHSLPAWPTRPWNFSGQSCSCSPCSQTFSTPYLALLTLPTPPHGPCACLRPAAVPAAGPRGDHDCDAQRRGGQPRGRHLRPV